MSTFLETPNDLQWLRDTHLKNAIDLPIFTIAIIRGNEDCPESIELYVTNDYRCPPIIYRHRCTDDGECMYVRDEAQRMDTCSCEETEANVHV